MNRLLPDTNAISDFLRGNTAILDLLAEADTVYFSIFVMAELLTGFKGGNREDRNKKYLAEFMNRPGVEIVEAGMVTADYFALIKHQLKQDGKPIPLNDVWIASHALQTGSMLLTRDRHFESISGLRVMFF